MRLAPGEAERHWFDGAEVPVGEVSSQTSRALDEA